MSAQAFVVMLEVVIGCEMMGGLNTKTSSPLWKGKGGGQMNSRPIPMPGLHRDSYSVSSMYTEQPTQILSE